MSLSYWSDFWGSLQRERQLKAVIGMGGKEFKILHKQFDEIYNKIQQKNEVTPIDQTKNDSRRETFFINYLR